MTVHKLNSERAADKLFDIETDINDLKVWTRALYHAVMAAESNSPDDWDYRKGLAILLAVTVQDKAGELYDRYHVDG